MDASGHWSERLDRYYKDDDWLDRHEASQVLTENSGRTILPEFLMLQKRRDKLHPQLRNRKLWYQYSELRFLKVPAQGGRKLSPNPNANALRQRKYREKRAQAL